MFAFPVDFYFISAFAIFFVGCSLLVHRPLYAAFTLIAFLILQAFFYLRIGFEYLAVLQVLIYSGAIMVLFVFFISLMNAKEEKDIWQFNWQNILAIPLVGIVAAILLPTLLNWSGKWKPKAQFTANEMQQGELLGFIGDYFLERFSVGFFSLAILLFIAILVPLVLTKPHNQEH